MTNVFADIGDAIVAALVAGVTAYPFSQSVAPVRKWQPDVDVNDLELSVPVVYVIPDVMSVQRISRGAIGCLPIFNIDVFSKLPANYDNSDVDDLMRLCQEMAVWMAKVKLQTVSGAPDVADAYLFSDPEMNPPVDQDWLKKNVFRSTITVQYKVTAP